MPPLPGPPRISVLLPVRDAQPFLTEALDSLWRQSLTDFEVVAVDDGSSDGSGELLEAEAAKESRLRVIRRPARGLVPALNLGLAACRGELVARMDADDRAHPRRLELQTAAFRRHPPLDVVSCLVSHFPEEEVGDGFRIYEEWLNRLTEHEEILRERFIESPLPHPSTMLPRRLLAAVGGYRDRGWPEDYDLWLRLARHGARFGKVRRRLHYWRQHPGRLTRTHRRYAVERFLACKAHHLAAGPLRGLEQVMIWGAGQTGRRISKHLRREGAPLTAFLDIDPRKIDRTLRGLPVFSPEALPGLLRQHERSVVLAAVASRGARELIRQRLAGWGLREGDTFWCVA